MENILVGLITLGGLYTIAQQEQNETFVQKPCPEQNQLVESKKSLESVPAKYTDEKKDTSFAKTFTTLSGEKSVATLHFCCGVNAVCAVVLPESTWAGTACGRGAARVGALRGKGRAGTALQGR